MDLNGPKPNSLNSTPLTSNLDSIECHRAWLKQREKKESEQAMFSPNQKKKRMNAIN